MSVKHVSMWERIVESVSASQLWPGQALWMVFSALEVGRHWGGGWRRVENTGDSSYPLIHHPLLPCVWQHLRVVVSLGTKSVHNVMQPRCLKSLVHENKSEFPHQPWQKQRQGSCYFSNSLFSLRIQCYRNGRFKPRSRGCHVDLTLI